MPRRIIGKRDLIRKKVDLHVLVEAIILLDSYRANQFIDPRSVDKAAKEGRLGKEFTGRWKEILPVLRKMASLPQYAPKVARFKRIEEASRAIGMIYIIIASVITGIAHFFKLPLPRTVIPIVLVSIVAVPPALLVFTQFITRKLALEIEDFFQKNPQQFKASRLKLRNLAQNLINVLLNQIVKSGEDPANYKLELYYTDYENIEIIEKPGLRKKYYTAIINVKNK